jgi:hypothetical protein
MSKFVIAPHMRLQEWVAEEKGYFAQESLDYEFHEAVSSKEAQHHNLGDKVGAFQTFEKGRGSDIGCACHWTVNVSASVGHGKLYADAYSVAPAAIFVAPESEIRMPQQFAGIPISVGYQSGSHYSTIQALEQYMSPDAIKLSFADGMLFSRMELLIDRKVPAAALFSGPYYFLEQLGFRKIIDTTFMMASLIRFHEMMDTRRWGPGERLVFEPYTKAVFDESFHWIAEHGIFAEGAMGSGKYEEVCVSLKPK